MEKLDFLTGRIPVPWKRLTKRLENPKIKKVVVAGSLWLCGFFLAGCRFLEAPLPAAVCLIAALGYTSRGLWVYLGAVAGSLLLWNTGGMLLTLSAGFLCLVTLWAMQDTPLARSPLLPPLAALGPGLLAAGLIFISGPGGVQPILVLLTQLIFLPLGTLAAMGILKNPRGLGICAAVFALVSGSGRILLPGGISLGAIAAAGILLAIPDREALFPSAVLAGLALDWSWQPQVSCIAALTVSAMLCSLLPPHRRGLRYGIFLLSCSAVILLEGGKGGPLFCAALLGGGISLLLPTMPRRQLPEQNSTEVLLHTAADALEEVYRQLTDLPDSSRDVALTDVYDQVTARVCSQCSRFSDCWTRCARETFATIHDAAIMQYHRGSALREDFPPTFRGKCRFFPEFLSILNESLRSDAQRRQRQHHRRELRAVLGAQYRILSDFLRQGIFAGKGHPEPLYRAVSAVSRQGKESISGDRSVCFTHNENLCFILCDGMGTGAEAAEDSRRAISLLKKLLQSGMAPDDALETLNAAAILREDGGASTVDLAWISLLTGDGDLYKWGGSPSYLISRDGVIKMGTASLPPGVGVGGTHQAQRIRLSLGRGEVLILLSDGVGGEAAEAILRQRNTQSPEELAAGIIKAGCSRREDDGTAAVLKLLPVSAR